MQAIPSGCRTEADFRAHYIAVRKRLSGGPKAQAAARVAATMARRDYAAILIYPMPIGPTLPAVAIGLAVVVPWRDFTVSPDAVLMHVAVPKGSKQAIRDIENEIMEREGLSRADLHGASRNARIVSARQEAIYRASKATGWSLPRLGRHFGDRDHTTILHSIRKVQAKIDAGLMPVPPECGV
jgi:hypothetical protein